MHYPTVSIYRTWANAIGFSRRIDVMTRLPTSAVNTWTLIQSSCVLTRAVVLHILRHSNLKFILQVRQTAVSYDGAMVLAACEDGTIHRWDLVQAGQQSSQQADLDEP